MKKKALFYSLHSYIWLHAYPEALIGEALQKEGVDVHFVTCDRALHSWCVSMEATGALETLSELEKKKICEKCVKNKELIHRHFSFSKSELNDYLDQNDYREVEEILAEIKPSGITDFHLGDVPVGIASLYNFTLNRKKQFRKEFSPEEWKAFLLHFRSTLVSYFGGKKMLDKHNPDYAIFYSSSYSINLVVRLQAEKRNISCFSIYAGNNWENRLQRMHITEKDSFRGIEIRMKLWTDKYRNKPATKDSLWSAQEFKEHTLKGKSIMVYGGGIHNLNWRRLRKSRRILEHQKVLFMATSSNDELYAAQAIGALPENKNLIFQSQLDWIQETIRFVEKRNDLFLIIRIHPRELPNRREATRSEHSLELEELLKSLPINISVNWPKDQLSLYDWLEVIDLGLTSWSSAGKEFALWGIPNLSYASELSFYPKRDLGWICQSKEDYFKTIDRAIQSGWSKERIFLSHRYLAFELEGGVFDLSDAIPEHLGKQRHLFWRIFEKLTLRRFAERKWLCFHHKPLRQSGLIAKKVTTGMPTEEILEEGRERLTNQQETLEILKVIQESANTLFGYGWEKEPDPSPLRRNLAELTADLFRKYK